MTPDRKLISDLRGCAHAHYAAPHQHRTPRALPLPFLHSLVSLSAIDTLGGPDGMCFSGGVWAGGRVLDGAITDASAGAMGWNQALLRRRG